MPLADLVQKIHLWTLTLDGVPAIVQGVLQPGITPSTVPGNEHRYIISGVDIDAIWLNRTPTGALNYPVVVEYMSDGLFSLGGGPFTIPFSDLPKGITTSAFANSGTGTGVASINYMPVAISGGGLCLYYLPSTGGSQAVWDVWAGYTLFYPPEGTGYSLLNPWWTGGTVDGMVFQATGTVLALGISPYLTVINEDLFDLNVGGQITYPDDPPPPLDPVFNIQVIDEPNREISWELPPEASGTTIQYFFEGLNYSFYQDLADLTFEIPGTLNQEITLISTLLEPWNTGEPVEYEFVPTSTILPPGDVFLVIDVSLTPTVLALTNPSGIYTLVPGKLHDTLYERVAGTTVATTVEVAIPDPFAICAYIPEHD